MDDYSPQLSHGVWLTLLGTALFTGAGYWTEAATWFQIGGGLLWLLAGFVAWMLTAESRTRLYNSMSRFLEELHKTPDERLDALKMHFPHAEMHWRGGKLTPMFENSGATLANLRLFLRGSNPYFTAAERDWRDTEGRYNRPEYQRILGWLVENHYIIPASATGNHSWEWYPSYFDLCWRQYGGPDFVPNLSPTGEMPLPEAAGAAYHAKPASTQA